MPFSSVSIGLPPVKRKSINKSGYSLQKAIYYRNIGIIACILSFDIPIFTVFFVVSISFNAINFHPPFRFHRFQIHVLLHQEQEYHHQIMENYYN
uniref:Uncharacterized protein n=1 Tax=Siphoviridae sp. ct2D011 TaxID=2825314 RepID=A0A8S5V971_9CAUD|nr:MAG TPA: hypothetical protein [Siphoviridae sp. ct2D011]